MTLYFIANTAARLLVRVFSKNTKLNPYKANLLLYIPTYIGMLSFGLLTIPDSFFSGLNYKTLSLMAIMGVSLVFFNKMTLIAQKHVETAPYMVLRQVSVPASVLLATVLLGESLTPIQILGMLIILFGSYLVASNGGTLKIKHIGKYELMTMGYGVFLAFYSISSRYLQIETSLSTVLIIGGLFELIPNAVVAARTKDKSFEEKINRSDVYIACLIGFFSAAHIITFWLAVEYTDNIALLSSIGSFRIVTIFLGSYLILKEKANLKLKLAGTAIALIGLLLT
jgi:drug/metabolite transporter (DMT)-like permease